MPCGKMWLLFYIRREALGRDVTGIQHIRFFLLPKCIKANFLKYHLNLRGGDRDWGGSDECMLSRICS